MKRILLILLLAAQTLSAQFTIRADKLGELGTGLVFDHPRSFVGLQWKPISFGNIVTLRVDSLKTLWNSSISIGTLDNSYSFPDYLGAVGRNVKSAYIFDANVVNLNASAFSGVAAGDMLPSDSITVSNSEKWLLLGDSFLQSYYCKKDESGASKWSRLTDFTVANWSVSGYDAREGLSFIQVSKTGDGHTANFDNLNYKYASLHYLFNDDGTYSGDEYIYWLERQILFLKSKGIVPVMATPWLAGTNYGIENSSEGDYVRRAFELAERHNIRYFDLMSWSDNLTHYNNAGTPAIIKKNLAIYGTNTHSNTMANHYFAVGMERAAANLRPAKAIKVWRADSAAVVGKTATQALDTLRFADKDDQVAVFDEISIAHYYGAIHDLADAVAATDEYESLINKTNVAFSNGFALLEFTIPTPRVTNLSLKVQLSASTYNIYMLNAVNSNVSSAYAATNGYNVLNALAWDSLGVLTGTGTIDISTAQYIRGNKLYFLVMDQGLSSFNMTGTPSLRYNVAKAEDVFVTDYDPTFEPYGNELLDPYFDATGAANWTLGTTTLVDGDLVNWTYTDTALTTPIRSPFECDDTLMFIDNADSAYRSIDLSDYQPGEYLALQIIAQNNDTDLDDMSSLQVSIVYGSTITAANRYDTVIDVYPVWMDQYVYIRKLMNYTTAYVILKKNNAALANVHVAKVGLKKVRCK